MLLTLLLLVTSNVTQADPPSPSQRERSCASYRGWLAEESANVVTARDLHGNRRVRPLPAAGFEALEGWHFTSSMVLLLTKKVLANCDDPTARRDAQEISALLHKPDACLGNALTPQPEESLIVKVALLRYAACMQKRESKEMAHSGPEHGRTDSRPQGHAPAGEHRSAAGSAASH